MTKPKDWTPHDGTHNFSDPAKPDPRYDFHLRNTRQLTPNCFITERCNATKVTPKSKWYPHLFILRETENYDAASSRYVPSGKKEWMQGGYVSATRSWRGPGFKASFHSWQQPGDNHHRWGEAFVPTVAEGETILIAIGKGLWP